MGEGREREGGFGSINQGEEAREENKEKDSRGREKGIVGREEREDEGPMVIHIPTTLLELAL